MINKTLKALYIALFFLTPLLMFRDTSELFEFNKMLYIYFITSLVLFFWILKIIVDKKIIFNKTCFFIPIILFLASQIISTVNSIDIHTSLFGYYGRFNGGLISIIAYLILYFAYVSNFDKKFTIVLLKTSLFSSLIVILWGISGKLGRDLSCLVFTGQFDNSCWTDQFRPAERMFSTLGQPNWLGAYLAVNFFIGIYFIIVGARRDAPILRVGHDRPLLIIVYLLFNFSALLFTRSRSALLAVAICFVLFLLYSSISYILSFRVDSRLQSRKAGNPFKTLLLLLVVLFVPLFIFKTGEDKFDKYLNLSTYTQKFNDSNHETIKSVSPVINKITPSSEIRKIVWTASLDLVKKYPLFGTGVETFGYAYYFVRPASHNMTSEWDYLYNKAHNEYLNYLATTGLFGFSTYILLIVFVCFIFIRQITKSHPPAGGQNSKQIQSAGWRTKSENSNSNVTMKQFNNQEKKETQKKYLIICLMLSYVTILITNFFGFSITVINLYFFLIPAFVFSTSEVEDNVTTSLIDDVTNRTTLIQKILIGINIIAATYLIVSIFLYFVADIMYAKANAGYATGEYKRAYRNLNTALSLHYEHVYEDKISYIIANLAYLASAQKDNEMIKNEILLADYYNRKSIKASPRNVLYWKTRSKNYFLFYQLTSDPKELKSGLEALDEAGILSPTDPKIPYSKALFDSQLGEIDKDKTKKILYQNKSLKELDKSTLLKPDFTDGYLFKGQLLKKYGRNSEAKKTFQFILDKLNPQDQEAKKELENIK